MGANNPASRQDLKLWQRAWLVERIGESAGEIETSKTKRRIEDILRRKAFSLSPNFSFSIEHCCIVLFIIRAVSYEYLSCIE